MYLSCSPAFADFSPYLASSAPNFTYLESPQVKPIKLVNPLYLDTTKAVKPIIKTTKLIPYNGELSEADYFSSQIDENTPVTTPQSNTTTNKIPTQIVTPPPSQQNSDFFAPPNVADEPVQELEKSEEPAYVAGVDTNNTEQVD